MNPQLINKKIAALFCGVALLIIGNHQIVQAQTTGGTVIVTGSRFEENLNEVPADIKVITRDEIANSTSQNIPDVLSQIGGLNVRNINGGGQLNLDATVDMGSHAITDQVECAFHILFLLSLLVAALVFSSVHPPTHPQYRGRSTG